MQPLPSSAADICSPGFPLPPGPQLAAGRSPADLSELVRRIRVVHSRQLGADSRKGLQLLYGFLVQHFASLAGGGGGMGGAPSLEHLDALVPHLVELTPQVRRLCLQPLCVL